LLGIGLTKDYIRRLVKNRLVPWDRDIGPGRCWWEGFLNRNPKISFRKPESLSRARVRMDNDVVNMDETKSDPKPSRVIATKGQRTVSSLTDTEQGHISIVGCISADGDSMPPLIIHKGANFQLEWFSEGSIAGSIFAATDNGWIDTVTFKSWFNKFISYSIERRTSPDEPILLRTRVTELILWIYPASKCGTLGKRHSQQQILSLAFWIQARSCPKTMS